MEQKLKLFNKIRKYDIEMIEKEENDKENTKDSQQIKKNKKNLQVVIVDEGNKNKNEKKNPKNKKNHEIIQSELITEDEDSPINKTIYLTPPTAPPARLIANKDLGNSIKTPISFHQSSIPSQYALNLTHEINQQQSQLIPQHQPSIIHRSSNTTDNITSSSLGQELNQQQRSQQSMQQQQLLQQQHQQQLLQQQQLLMLQQQQLTASEHQQPPQQTLQQHQLPQLLLQQQQLTTASEHQQPTQQTLQQHQLPQQQHQQQFRLSSLSASQPVQHHNGQGPEVRMQSTSLPLQQQQQQQQQGTLCSTFLNVNNQNLRNFNSPLPSRNTAAYGQLQSQFLTPTTSIQNRSPPFTPIYLNDRAKSPCPICPVDERNAFAGKKGISQHFRMKHPNFEVKTKDLIFGYMARIFS